MLVLGLGIGASGVVLSLARVVVLQPLPYGDPDRLVLLWNAREPGETTWLSAQEVVSYGRDARDAARTSRPTRRTTSSLTDGGEPERVVSAAVTPELFDTLQRCAARSAAPSSAADAAAGAFGPGRHRPRPVAAPIRRRSRPSSAAACSSTGGRAPWSG